MQPLRWRVEVHRGAAAFGAASTTVGALGLTYAVAATSPGFGYVSEAGVAGAPYAALYRSCIFAIGVGLLLLAVAVRPLAGRAAAALALAGPLAFVSGSISCTAGCPLPPHEQPTAADLWHAGASTSSLMLAALAMLLLATGPDGTLRRVSRIGATVAIPLLTIAGMMMLALGRGTASGVAERLALVAALSWLVSASLTLALPPIATEFWPGDQRSRHDGAVGVA